MTTIPCPLGIPRPTKKRGADRPCLLQSERERSLADDQCARHSTILRITAAFIAPIMVIRINYDSSEPR